MKTDYLVTINVKEKNDGNYVYSFSAEKENESAPQTLHAAVKSKSAPNGSFSNVSIPTSHTKSQEKVSALDREYLELAEDPENNEAAAIITAPYVLKRGFAISGHKNHKGNGYPSITYAAPVIINGEIGNVGVSVLFA